MLAADGNGAPENLVGLLRGGVVVLLLGHFREWYHERLRPMQHFVPLDFGLSNFFDAVQTLLANQTRAEGVAGAARTLGTSRLRAQDAECYTYRLLLEYAALMRYRPASSSSSSSSDKTVFHDELAEAAAS